MPQVDTPTFFPIVSWSLALILAAFLLFNMFFVLPLTAIGKLKSQWILYQIGFYWSVGHELDIASTPFQVMRLKDLLKEKGRIYVKKKK